MIRTILILIAIAPLLACAPKTIMRDSSTFAAENIAALKRQQEAADALWDAAAEARDRGDMEACMMYAKPYLLIDATAQIQAYRALWLAGLPYPTLDGTPPVPDAEQGDPGPTKEPNPISTVCY